MADTKEISGKEQCDLLNSSKDREGNNMKVIQQSEEEHGQFSQEEAEIIKKKYGGIVPKRPLISKDNERAYFDSADWALEKQGTTNGEEPNSTVEALQPKLQPTPHHQIPARRPSLSSSEGEDAVSCDETAEN